MQKSTLLAGTVWTWLLAFAAVGQAWAEAASPQPAVAVPQEMHHFGLLQPNEAEEHTFKIRNTGNAPLELQAPQGSCKCVKMRLVKRAVPPGEEAELWVHWRADGELGESFRQTVRVPTNDPKRKIIEFVITGDIGGHLRFEPGLVAWKNAQPGEDRTAQQRIVSLRWPAMHASKIASSLEGLEVQVVEHWAAESLADRERSSLTLEFHAPANLTGESFDEQVTLMLSPTAPGVAPAPASKELKPTKVTIPVVLEIASPLTITGAGYHPVFNKVFLGAVDRLEDKRAFLLVKVRDAETKLSVVQQTVTPELLEVTFQPYRPEKGLYRLGLRVPAGSLDRAYAGAEAGRVELQFDHPRAKSLAFEVEVSPGI